MFEATNGTPFRLLLALAGQYEFLVGADACAFAEPNPSIHLRIEVLGNILPLSHHLFDLYVYSGQGMSDGGHK